MANTPTGIARTMGLWLLIVATSGSIAIDFAKGNTIWAWFKIVVALTVIAYEIYYYIIHKKTISTKQKDFIKKHPFWGYLSLFLFALGLAGLILHLAVW